MGQKTSLRDGSVASPRACAHVTLQTCPCHPFHHYCIALHHFRSMDSYSLTPKFNFMHTLPIHLGARGSERAAASAAENLVYIHTPRACIYIYYQQPTNSLLFTTTNEPKLRPGWRTSGRACFRADPVGAWTRTSRTGTVSTSTQRTAWWRSTWTGTRRTARPCSSVRCVTLLLLWCLGVWSRVVVVCRIGSPTALISPALHPVSGFVRLAGDSRTPSALEI